MKIVTWNINSIRIRLPLINELVTRHNPDIVCIQETKVIDELFPKQTLMNMGFEHIVFSGEKSYNGVAILSKLPIQDHFSLPLYNNDARHIAIQVDDVEIHNFYVPAGGDVPDPELNPKFKHKLEYVGQMQDWFKRNRSYQHKIILVGDLNIAPHEHDVWSSRQLRDVVSHTKMEREALLALQSSLSFIDTGRHFVDLDTKLYSWWSYRNRDWRKSNRGRRLDHIWVSPPLKSALESTYYDQDMRDAAHPSDHIPCLLTVNL